MITCLFLSGLLPVARAEVSTTPPPAYAESLRPLLTPLEKVSKQKDPHAGEDEPGTVRLSERITRVAEDGTYLRAVHYIYQPYSEKGAEMLATDRFRFYSHQETVHLALARTVLPDGTEKPLGPNAAFLQKGSRGSGSMYDDGQDLVIVFPDVKPGVLCEVVVVYERKEPSVKGGYSEVMDWAAGWPVGERRHVVDLPAAWKDRVKTASVGKREVPMKELEAPEGRLRREWAREAISSTPYEPNPAPVAQTGPATWLGTFASWDEMAAWYQGLLAERGELDAELKAKVDEWTAAAKSPRETLDILFDHVANDIRYEGLEFGISGLQPYACGTVWKNQYGDCKDKANLLVAMLRHKGIAAKLVLVNTEHAGLVLKALPDYRHFNHAIAVAELPAADGAVERVFCDATISHGRAGLLGPSSSDREVLAIDGGKAQWLKTPPTDAGEDFYQFELELTAEGRLSGWLTLTSRGYYGVRLADSFAGVDRDTARERLRSRVTDFIAGAEVVDFVVPAAERTVDQAVVKVYLTGPPRQPDQQGRLSLPFPSSPGVFNDYGDTEKRQTSYFQWRDKIRVDAAIRLPEGWQPEALPQPLKLDTPAYLASASWSLDGRQCKSALWLECREALIPADKVAVPAQANRALMSWLQVPLLLKQGGEAPAKDAAPSDDRALPLMPTGEGQLTLVNRLFPAGSDAAKRRAALEKVIRFFPNDPATVFSARVELAYVDFLEEDYKKAGDAFAELVKRRPDGVDAETFAHARYLRALSIREAGMEDEAIALLRELAADQELSDYRRAWAAVFAGEWLAKRRPLPVEAIALLQQAVAMEEECRDHGLAVLIPALAAGGEGAALANLLATGKELEGFEDGGAALLKQVAEAAKTSLQGAATADLLPWMIQARDLAEGDRKKLLADTCAALEDWHSRGDAYSAVRAGAVGAIEKLGSQYFPEKEPEGTAAEIESKLGEIYMDQRDAWMKLAAGYLRKFEPTPKFPQIVWQFLSQIGVEELAGPPAADGGLFAAISAATDRLPKSDTHYWECQFTKTWWLRDLGKFKEAEASYRAMMAESGMPPAFAQAAWHGLGEVLELQERWQEAAECYLKFKDERHEHLSVAESLLRAGLMQARTGKQEEALATWQLLADVPETNYENSALSAEISDAVALAADAKATLAQWRRMETWWKKQFLPYYKAIAGGAPDATRIFLSDQGEALDRRCQKAVAAKDMTVVARDLASVAAAFRWLPCHLPTLNQMAKTYVRPLRPGSVKEEGMMLEEGAAAVKTGVSGAVEFSIRMRAGWAFDRGEPGLVLELLDGQSAEAPGRSEEHRERCGYIFGLAAEATGKKLEQALAYSGAIAEHGAGFLGEGQWAALHADLLVKSGKPAEAVAFLKAKAADPAIKRSPQDLKQITAKLAALSERGGRAEALVASAKKFLKQHGPVWYEHVGPADLEDDRIGDPAKVLQGDLKRFHEAEVFRLKMLIALSGEGPIESREEAYSDAVFAAGKWRKTWQDAVAVWSHVLDDGSVSEILRLGLLWKAASASAAEGQVEAVAALRAKPAFENFTDLYADRYFPMLEEAAKGRRDGPAVLKAGLARLGEQEIDAKQFQLLNVHYAMLLGAGDFAGAEAARDALKDWKLAPEAASGRLGTRLAWVRQASAAQEVAGLHEVLRETFKQRLEAAAAKAPAGWQQRVELEDMNDLTDEQSEAVRAAIVTSGFRLDRTNPRTWFVRSEYWLKADEPGDREKLLGVLPPILSLKSDQIVSLMLVAVLSELPALPDGGWADVDEVLRQNSPAGKRPMIDAIAEFWRAYRSYKSGTPVDATAMLKVAKGMGFLATPALATTMEALIINGDTKGLELIVDASDADELSESQTIGTYLEALRVLGRDEERELVMESAERVIREEMMTAWVERSPSAIRRATDLAILCGKESLLSQAWRKELLDVTADKLTSGLVRARMAGLDGDWEAVRKALGAVAEEADDTEAAWHWLMGRALAKLGKPELARPHLEKVVARGLIDLAYYREAVMLLKELGQ